MSSDSSSTLLNKFDLPPAHPKMSNIDNPVVFFDISVDGIPLGRVVMELFAHVCPKTSENFRQFCTGEHKRNGIAVGYKGSSFHRVIENYIIQGGDFLNGDGTGVTSIYGDIAFEDENHTIRCPGAGFLAMANSGVPNSNGSQFFITTGEADWINEQHVFFGQVIDGMSIIRQINVVKCGANNIPIYPILVTQCGEL